MKRIFRLINVKSINTAPKGKKILIADRGRIETLVRNYCAIRIISEKYEVNPTILIHNSFSDKINILYKKIGFKKFIKTFDIRKNYLFTILSLIKSIFSFSKLFKFFIKPNFHNFIYNFEISNIKVGDIIYDRYIRDNKKYLSPNFKNFSFLKYSFITIYKIHYLEKYLVQNKFELVLINTHSYTNNYSIIFKLAKKLKINILYLKDFQISYFKNGQYNQENDPRILTKKKLDHINFTKKKRKLFLKHMQKRIGGKLPHFDVRNAFGIRTNKLNKYLKHKKIILGDYRKKILIAAHALSDANHFYFEFNAKSPFFDYHTQLIKTLNFAKKHKDILFLLRPHPSSKFWNEQGIVKQIFKKYKSTNIILVDNRFSTNDILNFVDTTITVHGTIGIETAGFYKKKPILAGTGLYSNLGFTFDTLKEKVFYKNILLDKSKHYLNSKELKLSEKALYYYELLSKENYKSLISRNKILISDQKYLNDLNNFLKVNKIENDKYYQILKKKLNSLKLSK